MKRKAALLAVLALVALPGCSVSSSQHHAGGDTKGRTLQVGGEPRANIAGAGLRLAATEGSVEHYHAHLDVFLDGAPVTVPANLGIVPGVGIADLHTHDTSGVVHIETATAGAVFTVQQLLTEWGLSPHAGCIGGVCDTDEERWMLWVNGKRRSAEADPAVMVLRAHDEVVLNYGGVVPHIPATYAFPDGE